MITQQQPTPASPSLRQPSQVFQDRVRTLPGVLAAEARDTGGAEPTIVVYLHPEDQITERRVYELESEVYDAFPGGLLEVLVLRQSEFTA